MLNQPEEMVTYYKRRPNEFELLDVAKNLLKGKSKLTETKKSKFKKDIDEYAINGSSKDAINKLIAEIKEA